jgi:hypothetical protein
MGYNASFAVLSDTALSELPVEPGAFRSFDEASSITAVDLTAAQVGPHTVLIDPGVGDLARALAAKRGVGMALVTLAATSDVYIIESVAPDGEPVRRRIEMAGEIAEDFGTPLPAETALTDTEDVEDAHLAVLERLVGASLSSLIWTRFLPVTG